MIIIETLLLSSYAFAETFFKPLISKLFIGMDESDFSIIKKCSVIWPIPGGINNSKCAFIDSNKYQEMYTRSINESNIFWGEQAEKFLTWFSKWDSVQQWDYNNLDIKWFTNAKLNVSYNCLDRHIEERGDQVAIIWESDEPDLDKHITYRELHVEVCKFANVLKSRGAKKGDCVSIYMPMVPEAAVMVCCSLDFLLLKMVIFLKTSSSRLPSKNLYCGIASIKYPALKSKSGRLRLISEESMRALWFISGRI